MKTKYLIVCLLLLICMDAAYGAPTITSSTDGSDDIYPVLLQNENITFTVVPSEAITLYIWIVDDVNQSNNYDNLTTSWTTSGYKTVTVNATGASGTSATTTFNPYVKKPMTSGAQEVSTINEAGYDNLLDELNSDEPDFEVVIYSALEPFSVPLGNVFFVVIFGLPFIMMWIRQESMLNPALFGLVFGTVLFAFMPATFALTASAFIVLSLMGILFVFYKERR